MAGSAAYREEVEGISQHVGARVACCVTAILMVASCLFCTLACCVLCGEEGFSSVQRRARIEDMKHTSLPQPHEQHKIERLLARLSKVKPISAKPAPIVQGLCAIQAGYTAHAKLFFST